MGFKSRITMKMIQKKRHEQFTKSIVIIGLILLVFILTGCNERQNEELIEEIYTVQDGDTLWSISERYLQKNTAGRRYILEFISGIEQDNPWLLRTHDQIEVGDKLHICYWVSTEGGEHQ